eukprot:GILI01004592.1.p1 GENE.GILI01004592.1~~GILI01004592.1.p1  ORF type:complete len:326 (-),score=101.21 GILI01004592.1:206-1183(-)
MARTHIVVFAVVLALLAANVEAGGKKFSSKEDARAVLKELRESPKIPGDICDRETEYQTCIDVISDIACNPSDKGQGLITSLIEPESGDDADMLQDSSKLFCKKSKNPDVCAVIFSQMKGAELDENQLKLKLDQAFHEGQLPEHTINLHNTKQFCASKKSQSAGKTAISDFCHRMVDRQILGCVGRVTEGSMEEEGCQMCVDIVTDWIETGAGRDACDPKNFLAGSNHVSTKLCRQLSTALKGPNSAIKYAFIFLNEHDGPANYNPADMCINYFKMCAPPTDLPAEAEEEQEQQREHRGKLQRSNAMRGGRFEDEDEEGEGEGER